MEADFSGYATRNNLKCSDGRTIRAGAFKHCDGLRVPLVWQHQHNDPTNVLGHAILEGRKDGTYAYGFFNDSDAGQHAKTMVKHGDITALSIYANKLVQNGDDVLHGSIREVSLVLSGANPGAYIENVNLVHGDDVETLDDEAIIYTGLEFKHEESTQGAQMTTQTDESTNTNDKTVGEIFESFTDEQKQVVYYMIGVAMEDQAAEHGEDYDEDNDLSHDEGDSMTRNVFEQGSTAENPVLTHSEIQAIVSDAQKCGSLKEAVLAHANEYGITNIDMLFPDAKLVTDRPDFIKRQTEWVSGVLNGVTKSPFSRIKSRTADITHDEARALGYIKGNLKKDEWFSIQQRETTPQTIYKKQKLDRDDIIDITDFDVVAWIKAEMRIMLDEEIARAILIGDGRPAMNGEEPNPDKIKEDKIRPIAHEDEFYAHKVVVGLDENTVENILRARKYYKGTGTPALYTTDEVITEMLLQKDKMGRRLYNTEAELASALRVSALIPVEVMEKEQNLLAIMVNIKDYTVGADRGGQVSMFDDFDIDYNQYKYLLEGRMSGALTMFKSAIVFEKTETVEEGLDEGSEAA